MSDRAQPASVDRLLRVMSVAACLLLVAAAPLPTRRGWRDEKPAAFASPDEAVNALVTATWTPLLAELRRILEPEGRALIWSGDRVADRLGREKFIAAYDQGHHLERPKPLTAPTATTRLCRNMTNWRGGTGDVAKKEICFDLDRSCNSASAGTSGAKVSLLEFRSMRCLPC